MYDFFSIQETWNGELLFWYQEAYVMGNAFLENCIFYSPFTENLLKLHYHSEYYPIVWNNGTEVLKLHYYFKIIHCFHMTGQNYANCIIIVSIVHLLWDSGMKLLKLRYYCENCPIGLRQRAYLLTLHYHCENYPFALRKQGGVIQTALSLWGLSSPFEIAGGDTQAALSLLVLSIGLKYWYGVTQTALSLLALFTYLSERYYSNFISTFGYCPMLQDSGV